MNAAATIAPSPMNKTEAAWARELQMRVRNGTLQWFAFEAMKLRLGANLHYTPDFVALGEHGEVIVYEVKGFWRDDARAKIKAAAAMFPWMRFVAVMRGKKGGLAWECEEIKSHHSEVMT